MSLVTLSTTAYCAGSELNDRPPCGRRVVGEVVAYVSGGGRRRGRNECACFGVSDHRLGTGLREKMPCNEHGLHLIKCIAGLWEGNSDVQTPRTGGAHPSQSRRRKERSECECERIRFLKSRACIFESNRPLTGVVGSFFDGGMQVLPLILF